MSSHVPHGSAHHPLMNGIPINYLSRWLGHSSIQMTLIYFGACAGPNGELSGSTLVNMNATIPK